MNSRTLNLLSRQLRGFQALCSSGTSLNKCEAHGPNGLFSLARLAVIAVMANLSVGIKAADSNLLQPHIAGDWWQVAGDPNLGTLTTTNQQPVDFGVWQAADGTWQLWSCIRGTREPGKTRLFYRWEGAKLTDSNWKPLGVAMHANTNYGEVLGGLQAPYVLRDDGRFLMFYGGWEHICLAASAAGKEFERVLDAQGKATLFGDGAGNNTRDPMVLRVGSLWYCYYTAYPQRIGADYCRTSSDLREWSQPRLVAGGGQSGNGPYSAECPFVVQLGPGQFYLFRTQH
jgi:hypothetical protein